MWQADLVGRWDGELYRIFLGWGAKEDVGGKTAVFCTEHQEPGMKGKVCKDSVPGHVSHAHTCPAAQHHTLCALLAEARGDRQEMWVRSWGSACITQPPWTDLFSACGGRDLWVPDLDGVKNSSSPTLRRWGSHCPQRKEQGMRLDTPILIPSSQSRRNGSHRNLSIMFSGFHWRGLLTETHTGPEVPFGLWKNPSDVF